jgi:hypothetical protein
MRPVRVWLGGVGLAVALAALAASGQETATVYQGPEAERFLQRARITATRELGTGVTRPLRVTLEQDGVTRQALFKSIDESKQGVTKMADGSYEVDYQDSWQTEIAAYAVDRLIGLGLVPATVERRVAGRVGSLQWWVESMMPEAERVEQNLTPPDFEAWNRVKLKLRLFDELIANADRHLNNILITSDFDLRLIDHSRSFRTNRDLKNPEQLTRFSRALLDGITRLDRDSLRRAAGRYLTAGQIDRLLQRRDAILKLAAERVAQYGEAAIIYP